jgi:hypothetical protein
MNMQTGQASRRDLVARQIGAETILVPVKGGIGDLNAIYTLNEAGTEIWQMICAGKTIPEIVNTLCGLYDISAEEAARDTTEFMDHLRALDLLHESPASRG